MNYTQSWKTSIFAEMDNKKKQTYRTLPSTQTFFHISYPKRRTCEQHWVFHAGVAHKTIFKKISGTTNL